MAGIAETEITREALLRGVDFHRQVSRCAVEVHEVGPHRMLAAEFPEISERVRFHIPDEKEKRHGQAIAAASLPAL